MADKKEIEKMIKRSFYPENFKLDAGPILIDVVDREYGIYCECGSRNFSEDAACSKLYCSECEKTLATRFVEDGWIAD